MSNRVGICPVCTRKVRLVSAVGHRRAIGWHERPVTVDTGGPDDVFIGALVTWLHVPRGGYGYTMPVDAKVVSYSRRPSTAVRIEVTTKRGAVVGRVVDADNLRWSAPMKPRPNFARSVDIAFRRLRREGKCAPAPMLGPGTARPRKQGTKLHRVRARRDGRPLDVNEAYDTFAAKPWSHLARYIGSANGWHCFELPEGTDL